MKNKFLISVISLLIISAISVQAQEYERKLSPRGKEKARKEQMQSSSQKEKKPKVQYPLLNGLMIGVDLFDPAAMLLGQKYGSYQVSAELNLYNRFFPIWEIGIGRAKDTPEDMNFTYKGKPALYNRIGMNYNFRYGSESPNFFYVGIRYGFSSFKYDITDITLNSPYWDETYRENILDQKSTAHWLELVGGIRVKIIDNLYMGWSVRYKRTLSVSKTPQASPWYIPGFGTKDSNFGFAYTISYNIPIRTKIKPAPTQAIPLSNSGK